MTDARRLLAEAIGTGTLLAVVVGSGIMGERLAGGNQALALLANSLATGAGLFVLISLLAPVSGAHLNPLVSAALWWRGELSARAATGYALAQVIGAVLGAILANLMFDLAPVAFSETRRAGGGIWLSEIVAACGLLLTVMLGAKYRPAALPALVGAWITAAYWFTASTSFANPAVTLARSLTPTFAGIRPGDVPAFVLAQCAGVAVAVLLYAVLVPQSREKQAGLTK